LGAFGTGAATGALVHAKFSVPTPAFARPTVSASPSAPREQPPETSEEPPPATPVAVPLRPPAVAAPKREPSSDTELAAESALLENARSALTQSESARALKTLADHERRFPRGKLVEEREALRVQALVLAGDADEARIWARRFHERFPNSLLGPAVDATLESLNGEPR
jgi:hypothetical protein